MKRFLVYTVWTIALALGLAGMSGCGSSGAAVPSATISGFAANPSTITAGGSTSLTGIFSGGTGVITPGNLSVTSGTAVSVSPTVTTTYTLTVTNSAGSSVTQTATVTVNAVSAATITSFIANPSTITSGGSSSLTGIFTGGTGVITPGSIAVTSGTAASVSPTTTTTYTLTVTNSAGASVTQTAKVTVSSSLGTSATVTVDPTNVGSAVTNQILGMNLPSWFDVYTYASDINTSFSDTGIKAVRWPGGSWSDDFHWGMNGVTPYMCQTASPVTGGWGGYGTFAQFVTTIVKGGSYDLALTANYGSNETCTGGGDPAEAAAWAAAALNDGVTVSHMSVGNEEYGSWEADLHSSQHDPSTYASAVIGTNGYYKQIKAASSNTLVGVLVDANCTTNNGCTDNWDSTVLANAKGYYDFVEYHFYAENPGNENDTFLVQQAAQVFTQNINTIKQELTTAGETNTPIYVGELGSVSSNPGKQSMSITQGLYAGQMLGEMMNDGVSRATWWIGFGNCNGTAGNNSSSLYGWQDYGAYNIFSDGSLDTTCSPYGSIGTMSPTARAFQLFSNVAVNGEHVLTPSVSGDTADVRAYAATNNGGTALALFNLNEDTNAPVTVTLTGQSSASSVTVQTYDKALYDQSANNVWAAPTTTSMGAQSLPLTLTLTPWSMNVVIIKP